MFSRTFSGLAPANTSSVTPLVSKNAVVPASTGPTNCPITGIFAQASATTLTAASPPFA